MDALLASLCCCHGVGVAALRGASRELRAVLNEKTTTLRVAPQCPGVKDGAAWQQLILLLKALPNLRHLDLQDVEIPTDALAELRRALPRCKSWDLRFCWRIPWHALKAWLHDVRGSDRQICHTLLVHPSPDLTPLQVVIAQAYALHCGRIDVCFRFASPLNKLMTGPLEKFSRLFDPPSRYSTMLGCDSFTVEEEKCHTLDQHLRKNFIVSCFSPSASNPRCSSQSYLWQLSYGPMEDGAAKASWSTDSVVPIDMDSFWDGSFLVGD